MRETLTLLQQDTVTVIMSRRRSNPITGKEIASVIGLKPRSTGKEGADMRSIINALRCKGYPICASGLGYWWPKDKAELTWYTDRFRARMLDMSKAIAGMEFGVDLIEPTAAAAAVEQNKRYYYEVIVEGERKCFEVVGTKLGAFLEKYPDAKKL